MNPPYAEATTATTVTGTGENKTGVAMTMIKDVYTKKYSKATNELSVQFFIRIIEEISNCNLATFGKLAYVNSSNFRKFREYFKAEYKKGFIVPANTFDNVNGSFPIGFLVWDLEK
jgi:hypothetical protein